MIDPAETMKQFEALDARYNRLRASHNALLAAAKAVIPEIGMSCKDRKELICIQGRKFDQLQAAIAKAEELVK
jgi:hypothetical protein